MEFQIQYQRVTFHPYAMLNDASLIEAALVPLAVPVEIYPEKVAVRQLEEHLGISQDITTLVTASRERNPHFVPQIDEGDKNHFRVNTDLTRPNYFMP